MKLNRVDCIVGDSFFFQAAEKHIIGKLAEEHKTTVNKEYVFAEDNISKLNYALLPNIFDIEPKLVILRNIKDKLLTDAIKSLNFSNNVHLLIEIEKEKYDKRVKIFKELEKNGCIHNVGFAYYPDKTNDILNVAFSKMEEMLQCSISNDVKDFLMEYVPKTTFQDKTIHNLNRIFSELKKAYYYNGDEILLNDIKELVTYPQKHYELFDITQALSSNNLGLAINIIDSYVHNIEDARRILNLILSEIKIICQIVDKTNVSESELYKYLTRKGNGFDLLEDKEKNGFETKVLHPYRLHKILEKKHTSYFKDCHKNLKLCINAYNDLGYYADGYKVVLYKLLVNIIGAE